MTAKKFYEFQRLTHVDYLFLITTNRNVKTVKFSGLQILFGKKLAIDVENIGVVVFDFKNSYIVKDNQFLFFSPLILKNIFESELIGSKIRALEKNKQYYLNEIKKVEIEINNFKKISDVPFQSYIENFEKLKTIFVEQKIIEQKQKT